MRPSTPWRDTAWNLAGFILPLPVAVAAVPILMEGLGEARFGLLTLTWAVMAYFTLFDVGLGRATTQGIVRARAAGDTASMLDLCWSSTWAHLGLGLCGGVVLLLVGAPIRGLLGLPPGLAREFDIAIVWLALSVPCIVLATGARGVLEGLGRFDTLNLVRLASTLWTYVAPLVVVRWTSSLPEMVGAIAVGRVLAVGALAVACLREVPHLLQPRPPRWTTLSPLARLGLWITVATLAVPVMSTLDRVVIGARVSVEAVGWYAAPFEAVTRLWVISTSILTVAFPAFTAALAGDPGQLGRAFRHVVAALLLTVFPAAMLIVTAAPVGIPLWLGDSAGREAVLVTQWLAAGMAINVVAQAGATLLQATGHAERVARVQVAGVLLYAAGIWWAADRWGIVGVAGLWSTYGLVIAAALVPLAAARVRAAGAAPLRAAQWAALAGASAVCWGWTTWMSVARATPAVTLGAASILTLATMAWLWRGLVDADVRALVGQRLRVLA